MVHIGAEGHLYHRFFNGRQKIKFLPFTNANRNVFKKHLESLVEITTCGKRTNVKAHGMLRKSDQVSVE
jgi:hypothetical protein